LRLHVTGIEQNCNCSAEQWVFNWWRYIEEQVRFLRKKVWHAYRNC